MRFETAVAKTVDVAQAIRRGLQALRRADQRRVSGQNTRLICGSIDIDAALAAKCPNESRWDYAIGITHQPGRDRVIYVEVHPASARHVAEVIAKRDWLLKWLAVSAPLLEQLPHELVWIASGTVSILPNSPHWRRLAAKGIRFCGKRLEI